MKARTPAHDQIDPNLMIQALDGLCVGLVLVDEKDRVQWFNRAAQLTLGFSDDDSLGTPLDAAIRDPELAGFWIDAAQRDETIMGEVSLRWPVNAELKVNCTRSLDAGGRVIGRALMFCDVTRERAVQVELTREVAVRLMDIAADRDGTAQPLPNLTSQETRVLRLVGQGLSNETISGTLKIAPSTLRTHLKSIYRKIGVHSRPAAVRYAVRNHLG